MLPPPVASTSPRAGTPLHEWIDRASSVGDIRRNDHLVGIRLDDELLARVQSRGVLILERERDGCALGVEHSARLRRKQRSVDARGFRRIVEPQRKRLWLIRRNVVRHEINGSPVRAGVRQELPCGERRATVRKHSPHDAVVDGHSAFGGIGLDRLNRLGGSRPAWQREAVPQSRATGCAAGCGAAGAALRVAGGCCIGISH